MNNAKLILDGFSLTQTEEIDIVPKLRAEESKIVRILEAIQAVQKSKEWEVLVLEVFDNLAVSLGKELLTEAKREDADVKKLNRLAGELKWAERYADLTKLENNYKVQLQSIRTKLYGTQE